MLVRTCSQIGADPPMAAAAKSKKPAAGVAAAPASATPAAAADRPHSASPSAATYLGHAATAKQHHRNLNNNYMEEPPKPVAKLNFKPYENTVLTPSAVPPPAHNNHHHVHQHNNNNHAEDESRPRSSSSEDNGHGSVSSKKRKSASPRDDYHPHHQHKSSRRSSSSASSTEAATAADPSTNPIIRSGLEVMHGSKAFCPPPPMSAHAPYRPAADALAAFRHTYLPGAPPWMPAAVSLAAAAAASKPSPTSAGTGAECKDPMCGGPASGCGQQQHHAAATAAALAFASQYHPMMSVGGGCPAGCSQCDHQRYLTSLMAAVPAFYAAPPVTARPYTCSWVIPGGGSIHPHSTAAESAAVPTLCGKSFGSSDELLQHIRTHTSGSAAASVGPMSPTAAAAFSAYNSHLSRHLFHHHHPSAVAAYGKPSPPLSMMPPSPYSAFNPTAAYCYPPPTAAAAAAAAAYHHHHSLYSPRGDTSAATVSR